MEKHSDKFTLAILNPELSEQQTANQILACNQETLKYGLSLTKEQAHALAQTRGKALTEAKRVELNTSAVDKLILAFCDSSYIVKEQYEETLHDLIHLFYELKNSTWDTVSDDDLIEFLKDAFNHRCYGTKELLDSEVSKLIMHIHRGGTIKNYSKKNGE